MNESWRQSRWGSLATLEYGKGLRGYRQGEGAVRVFGTNGAIGWHGAPLVDQATVIVGRKGAYRGIHYSPDPCFVIDTAFYLQPREPFDMRWAYYQLLTQDINSMDSGSAIPSTSRDAFYALPVLVPPLEEQRAIAGFLGAVDDKIELNRRMNQTLEGIARAIFKSGFVDFDPVRAKMEGRQPYGMSGEAADLFPAALDSAGFPAGWGEATVADLVDLAKGKVDPREFPDEVFAHYSIPAFDVGQRAALEPGTEIRSQKAEVPEGSVLVSRLNPRISRVWLPSRDAGHRAIASTEFAIALPREGLTQSYLYCLFDSASFQGTLQTLVTGTSGSHQRVRPAAMLSIAVVRPPAPVVREFDAIVGPFIELVLANRDESFALGQLRDALLPKLISGEIRLKDAGAAVESAV